MLNGIARDIHPLCLTLTNVTVEFFSQQFRLFTFKKYVKTHIKEILYKIYFCKLFYDEPLLSLFIPMIVKFMCANKAVKGCII